MGTTHTNFLTLRHSKGAAQRLPRHLGSMVREPHHEGQGGASWI